MRKIILLFLCVLYAHFSFSQNLRITIDELFTMVDTAENSLRVAKRSVEAANEKATSAHQNRLPDINTSFSVGYLGDGYIWDRDFSNGMSVDIPHFGTNFTIEMVQILYGGGAINNAIALFSKGERLEEFEYEKQRQQVHFSTLGMYLNLYKAANQIVVYDQNIALVEKLIETLQAKHQQGTILSNAITR